MKIVLFQKFEKRNCGLQIIDQTLLIDSIKWTRPESILMGLPEITLPILIEQFTKQLVEKAGVLITPKTLFEFPGNVFRIGFGRKKMAEVIPRFAQFILNL